MSKVNLGNKVFTPNSLLDEIVYNIREIIAGGVTVKDWDKANNNETLQSITDGDVLVAINRNTVVFSNFYYGPELLALYYTNPATIERYAQDNTLIPVTDQKALLTIAVQNFLENYVEYNNYYRMLHGEPNYDENQINEGLWIDTRFIDVSTPTSIDHIYQHQPIDYELAEYTRPIYTLDLASKNILFENGTCENIVNNDEWLNDRGITKDEVLYLLHIGDREVDYYQARIGEKFSLIYCPTCTATEIQYRFQDLFEANRKYMLYTVYSDAYKERSDYYDNFMMVFLIVQTVIDLIVELPEYIIRRDIFDTRTCKYIFESNGVKYFKDIPLKYQVSLVKNLNRLIKFKSTDKCIVDIISIFGVENINVFRYYILKDRYVNDPGNLDYYANTKEVTDTTGETTIVEDNQLNYDLKFIKVPILDKYDNYIRTDTNLYDYDTLTETDRYWLGDRDYDTVKEDIKDLDFTVLRSKYYSIEAVIDLAKKNFTVSYFMNLLLYNKVDSSALQISLPNISTSKKYSLVNAILTLFSLSYIYYGVEDTIMDSRAKIARILGFNMEANLSKIATWLAENHRGLTLKDLHVDTFISTDKIMTFNELENIFFTNKECYDHIRSVMINPPSKEIYDAYKYIYDALLITNQNMENFLIGDNSVVDNYKEMGYTTRFINIPRANQYHNRDDYEREYRLFIDSIKLNELCFEMNENFNENHLFDLYVKDENSNDLVAVGTARMAFTYKEYLQQADNSLYSFIVKILSISKVDLRQEACINAIQAIVSYMKDYIDQEGDDAIPLDTVFSGLPSISMDFIKRYVEEVIDFFKSFKIFSHGSSILYVIDEKFENYVQLIEHILLKYLLDKSELIKIEDIIGCPMKQVGDKLIHSGFGIHTSLSSEERHKLIDKVWFNVFSWVKKNYGEFYTVDSFRNTEEVISKYDALYAAAIEYAGKKIPSYIGLLDSAERFSTLSVYDEQFTEKYIEQIQREAVDAILNLLVTFTFQEVDIATEKVFLTETRDFIEYYNEWMMDIASFFISIEEYDSMGYQDDMIRFSHLYSNDLNKIKESFKMIQNRLTLSDSSRIEDDIYLIPTQSYSSI